MNCFNSADGTGFFKGVERYNVLSQRAALAATQSRDVHGFWACLLRKMNWPLPPKKMDGEVIAVLAVGEQPAVLKALATETVSLITIARMLHDEDKKARRDFYAALAKEADSDEDLDFNDSIEGIK